MAPYSPFDSIFRKLACSKKFHFLCQYFAVSTLFLVILLVLAYAMFAIPVADDFVRATTQTFQQARERVVSDYFNWTGRWFSMAIQYGVWATIRGNHEIFFSAYRVAILSLLLTNFLGWFFLVKFVVSLHGFKALGLGLLIGGTYLAVYHSSGQTLYWLPGATEGGLSSLTAALVLWGSLPLFSESDSWFKLSRLFLLSAGVFVCSGCHELGGMFLTSFYGLAFGCSIFISTNLNRWMLFALLLISFVATATVVFAPGNGVRAAAEGMQTGSIFLAANSGSQIWLRTLRVLLSPPIILGAVILVYWASLRPDSFFKVSRSQAIFIFSVSFIALIVVSAFVAWKTAKIPAGRTVNFFVSTLVYTALPALIIWASRLLELRKDKLLMSSLQGWVLILFAVSILISPTLDRSFFSYKTHLPIWLAYQNSKHKMMVVADSSDVVFCSAPPPAPPMFFTETDITQNPDDWINRVQAKFYGLRKVIKENNLLFPAQIRPSESFKSN